METATAEQPLIILTTFKFFDVYSFTKYVINTEFVYTFEVT